MKSAREVRTRKNAGIADGAGIFSRYNSTMPTLHLKSGRVICPAQNIDTITDLWLADGEVAGIGPSTQFHADETIDCTGKIVCPGLIDMHVHLREPGREEDETIATGTAAAIAGGVTAVACMPNTEPALDTQAQAAFVKLQAKNADQCYVFPIGAVTKGREGKELAEIGSLVDGGAVAFTDDGGPVYNAEIMRRALEYTKMFGRAILVHAEILELTQGGVMNEGLVSTRLGLRGMPAVAEDIMIARDIMLAELTGGKVHILHVSTAGGVHLIRKGRKRAEELKAAGKTSFWISGEACPHHFILTDDEMARFDSNFKMSPPLRTRADVDAIIAGLKDGTLSVLATDHAPHAPEKKARELDQTPNGIVGLETFLPLVSTYLVHAGHLTWNQAIEKMTINPARVLGIDRGTLMAGRPADVTVIDPNRVWTIDAAQFKSKSRNTPFHDWKVTGKAVATIVGGEVKMRDGI
ncbi:MAG: dihydroorotase [Gemmataceae bacterium]